MTKRELNHAIKTLNSEIYRIGFGDTEQYRLYLENEAKQEFIRLYRADTSMKSLNRESVLIMFRLNQQFRFEPFHTFGIEIDTFNL